MSFEPDEQLDDWYKWLTTQCGHACVGIAGGLILWPLWGIAAPGAVFFVYLIAWEGAYQRFGAGVGDALVDSACVAAGAAVICGAFVGYWTAVAVAAVWAVFIAWGVWRRA
ncbi:hypothetical protein K0U83_24245 [bacterium]|nr:hypothetical protein [bacterium]